MKPTANLSLRKFCVLLLMMVSYTDTYVVAAPKGGRVVSGTATFQQDGNLTVITAGNKSIINYGSFNIGAAETVRFIQPGANSSVLNRVVGSANPTEIFGTLQANGRVFIINPYGIFFQNGAVINVGSLYAGAGNLSDADFAKGKIKFTDLAGDVRNDGIIAADNRIALLGANVVNTGSVNALKGMAMMISGKDVYVGAKDGNIFVQANGKSQVNPTAASRGSISNSGTVAAPRVVIGGGDIYSTAISNSGLIQGHSVTVNAGRNGTATVGGKVDATSRAPGATDDAKGGSIQVLGGTVALKGATLDASGTAGGGSVRIGGDFHGAGDLAHATTTSVDAATTIKADASGATGDGGTVVLWSDSATRFEGNISAKGGSVTGDGGSAEVSSAETLTYRGTSDLRSPAGKIGSLLLDPRNITIDTALVAGTTLYVLPVVNPTGDPVLVDYPTAGAATDITIVSTNLATALTLANVTLDANNNISFLASVAPASGTRDLVLNAGNSITFATGVSLTLGGAFNATFNAAGADAVNRAAGAAVFQMQGTSSISANGGVTITGGTLAQTGNGTTATASTIAANTGAITLNTVTTAGTPIQVTNSAGGKDIVAVGTLSTTPTAADTAGGNVTLTTGGNVSASAITATGTGTGAGGVVSLADGASLSLNGAITGASLTTGAGAITFNNGATVTTSGGGQNYGGGVLLALTTNPAPTTLTDTNNGDILFASTVDGSGAQPQALTLSTTGVQTFTGAVGNGTALGSLTTSGTGRVIINGGVVKTSAAGGQSYGGAVVLNAPGAATTLTATGGNVLFTGPVRSAANPAPAQALTVNATAAGNNVTFSDTVGANNPLASLNLAGPATINLNGGAVTTNGAAGQVYTGPVVLGGTPATTQLTATGAGPVSFTSTVNGARALTVTAAGLTKFGGSVGSTLPPLTSLTVDGAGGTSITGGGAVMTSGLQNFATALSLGINTVLTSTSGGAISVPTITGGGFSLAINTGGVTTFGGAASGLSSVNTDGPGSTTIAAGTITTTGLQNYRDAVTLGAPTTLASTANGAISLVGITGAGFSLAINTGGLTTLGGAATGLGSLTTDPAGTTTFNGGTITTSGLQSFGDALTLGAPTTLTSTGGGAITFAAITGGGFSLAVNTGGTTTFGGAASGLASLTTDAFGTTTISGGTIATTGLQTFADPLTLVGDTTLESSGGGAIGFAAINSRAGDPATYALTVNTIGTTTFGDTVGGTTPLSRLITDGTAIAGTVFAPGGQTIFTSPGAAQQVTTNTNGTGAGAQTYNDDVVLTKNTTLQSTVVLPALTGGAITFRRTVTGPGSLTLGTTGMSTFNGTVGQGTALAALSVTGPVTFTLAGALPTTAATASVITSGAQTYGGAVTLGGNAALLSTADNITFSSTINGAFGLSVSAAGNETFGGLVGATTPLLSLTTDAIGTAAGTTIFQTGGAGVVVVRTSGAGGSDFQTYNDGVQLQQDATFQSGAAVVNPAATAGGNITFNGRVDGLAANGQGLTVNTAGVTIFNGLVGNLASLRMLTTDKESGANEQTQFNMSLVGAANNVAGVNVGTGGVTINDPAVFNVANSSSAKVPASISGVTGTNNPSLTSTGPQSYLSGITLQNNTVLQGTTLNLVGAVVGAGRDLTLDFSGSATLVPGIVNTGSGIRNFASVGNGGTTLNGNFQTTGYQYYGNAVTLLGPTVLTSGNAGGTNPGNIAFGGTVQGPFSLTLNPAATGRAIFFGTVGGGTTGVSPLNLASLTVNGNAQVATGGGFITTSGLQSFTGNLSLDVATTLASTGSTISVGSLTGNGNNLQVTATGSTFGLIGSGGALTFTLGTGIGIFNGTVAATGLTVLSAGEVDLNGGSVITSGGGQTYRAPVAIGTALATTLTETNGGVLFFNSTLDNRAGTAATLTLNTSGTTTLNGAVGSGALPGSGALGTFAITGSGPIKVNGGSVRSSGSQGYTGPLAVGVAATTTFTSTGSTIQFGNTLDGTVDGTQSVTVNAAGNELFSSPVGSLVRIQNLTTDAVAGAGQAQFNFDLNAFPAAAAGVNVAGNVTINDAPGAGGGVLFGVTGSTISPSLRPTVLSGGSQTYANGGSATQNTVLVGGGSLTTGGTFNFGNHDLTVRFGQLVTVTSGLGGVANFRSDGAGGTLLNGPFATTATQYYGNNVTLLNNPVLNAVGSVLFTSKVDGGAASNTLLTIGVTGADSQVIFNGLVGDTTTLTGLNVTTSGTTPGSGTRFNMAAGSSTLGKGGVNVGATGVTITGPVFFNETGSTLLTADHPSVISVGPQTYNGPTNLQNSTGLLATGAASDIIFGTAGTGNGTINGPASLAVSTLSNEIFNGLIGNTTALASFATDTLFTGVAGSATNEARFAYTLGGAQAGVRVDGVDGVKLNDQARFTIDGSTVNQPSVLTFNNGTQTYFKPVLLGAQTVFTSTAGGSNTTAFTGGGQITFGSTVASATAARQNLYVRTGVGQTQLGSVDATSLEIGGALVTFTGNVGPVGIFSVLANSPGGPGGSVRLGGTITTTGPQLFGDDVILYAPTVLNSTDPATGSITFNGRVDSDLLTAPGAFALTLNTPGLTLFKGAVGSTGPLASLTTDFVPGGDAGTQFNINLVNFPAATAGVRVIGAVTINDPVVFNVQGSTLARPSVVTGVNGGTGSQFYARAALLQADTVLTDLGTGTITFGAANTNNGTIDGAFNLAVNTGGDEVFNGLIGNTTPLASLQTDAVGPVTGSARFNMNLATVGALAGARVAGAVDIHDNVVFNAANNGGTRPAIQTGGLQNYRGAATLAQNTILGSTGGGDIAFRSTVDGGFALTLNTAGRSVFDGLVGSVTPLDSLTTDNAGAGDLGTQFNVDLTLFPAAVAGVRVVNGVTINDPVTFNVNGSTLARPTLVTGVNGGAGSQTYNAAATLARNTVLTNLGTGNITFGLPNANTGTINGAFDLFVNTGGDEVFNGLIGNTTPLASLQTDAVGPVTGSARFNMNLATVGALAGARVAGAVDIHDNVVFNAANNGGTRPAIQTGGLQNYRGAATLAQNTILGSTGGGDIAFRSTVDGGFALTLNTAGRSVFDGLVGSVTPLDSLTTDNAGAGDLGTQFNVDLTLFPAAVAGVRVVNGVTINDPVTFNVNGSTLARPTLVTGVNGGAGSQTYNAAATLARNTVLTNLGTGNITFGLPNANTGTINGAFDLFVNTGGDEVFNGLIGNTTPLASLQTDAVGPVTGSARFNMNLATVGALAGARVAGAVDIHDNVVFNAANNGGTRPAIQTGGLQNYRGAATLAQNTILGSTGGGDIAFRSTVDGGFALTLNTAGRSVFDGLVGSVTPLDSLTTDNAGAGDLGTQFNVDLTLFPAAVAGVRVVNGVTINDPVTFNVNGSTLARPTLVTGVNGGAGSQTYNAAATLARNTVLTNLGTGNITFGLPNANTGTINGTFDLFVNTSGLTTFNGAVGTLAALGSLTTDVGGTTLLLGGTIITTRNGTTSGAQLYNDAVQLGVDTTLISTATGPATVGGNLTFASTSTLDGGFRLTLTTGGLTQFNGLVGSVTPLTALTSTLTGSPSEETQFNMAVGAAAAGVTVNGPVTIEDDVRFNIAGASPTQPGVLTLGNADQNYNGAVRLATSTYLTSAATLPAPFTGGGGIFFNSTAGISSVGGSDLYVASGVGTTRFDSTINVGSLDLGGAKATFHGPVNLPGVLSVLNNGNLPGGFVLLAGGGLTTAGAQTFRVGVLLGADTVLTSLNTAGDGGAITFLGTVDSDPTGPARALTLNTSGDEIFNGLVGSIGALASLTTDAPGPVGGSAIFDFSLAGTPTGTAGVNVLGAVTINDQVVFNVRGTSLNDNAHPTILTGGAQTYNGAATLVADNTALVSSGAGDLTFNSTLNGPHNLTLSSAGNEIFNDLVGRSAALASLATDTTGLPSGQARFNMDTLGNGPGVNVTGTVTINDGVLFNAANVSLDATILSGGTQTYQGAAFLARDTVLTSSAGSVIFNNTLDSNAGVSVPLTTNSGVTHQFNNIVGGTNALARLTTNGGTTQFNMTLPATSTAPAGVRINGALTVNGAVVFNVAGSSTAKPTVLTLGNGAQTYNGPATLLNGTVLTASNGGNLVFASTVDGSLGGGVTNLALNTTGLTTFNGAVGGSVPLASLTTDADPATLGGTTILNGSTVTTVASQDYNDSVVLLKDTTLTSTTGGTLHFHSILNGDPANLTAGYNLTLNSTGDEIFNANVGGTAPLLTLTTDADPANRGGSTIFNLPVGVTGPLTVTTTGAQVYNDAISLRSSVTLTTGAAGSVTSGAISGPGFDLTVNTGTGNFGAINAAVLRFTIGGAATFAQITGTDMFFNVGGLTTFNGPISASNLTVGRLAGSVQLNGGSVKTTGFQNYGEPVTLGNSTLLQAGTAIDLVSLNGGGSAPKSGNDLTLTAASVTSGPITNVGDLLWTVSGLTTLNGAVAANSLHLNDGVSTGGSTLTLNAGTVSTNGDQIYNARVTLGQNTNLTASSGGAKIKLGILAGARKSLTISASSAIFDAVSGVLDLDVFAANTRLDGGSVSTVGHQLYRGDVLLGAGTTLTSASGTSSLDNGDAIRVSGTVQGRGQDLNVVVNGGQNATFHPITGTRNTTFAVTGATNLAGDVDAATLLVSGGRELFVQTGQIKTSDFQTYGQSVTLQNDDVRFESTGGGKISFAVLDADAGTNRNVTVATAGTTLFGDVVGGRNQLASLTVGPTSRQSIGLGNEDGRYLALITGGSVHTTGAQYYNGAVTVDSEAGATSLLSDSAEMVFDRSVTGNAGNLSVEGRNILMRGNANIVNGGLSLGARGADDSILLLDGNSYTGTGDVVFNGEANVRAADLLKFSTIVLTNPGTVNIVGANFRMGDGQKLIDAGSLSIDVNRGRATIGDLAALNTLRIQASQVFLLNRPLFTGSALGSDSGLNIVAGQSISFGSANIQFAHPANQVANFVTTTGLTTIVRRTGLSIFRNPDVRRQFAQAFPVDAPQNRTLLFPILPLQPVGGGSQTLDTAAALSGALPDQKPLDIPVDVNISASQMEELRKLGINPRKATKREYGSSKRALFAQLVDSKDTENYGRLQPIKGGVSQLVPSEYVVVVDRMSEREVQTILKAFEDLYGKDKAKAPTLGAAYQKAYDDYTVEKQTDKPDGFVPFLKAKAGKYPDVDSATRGFDNLFGYIEHMGLTEVEVTKAEGHIVSDLGMNNPSSDDMVKVINAQRKALPPGQKAPSTKVPPAPPMSSPRPAATPATKKVDPLKTVQKGEPEPAQLTTFQAAPPELGSVPVEIAGL